MLAVSHSSALVLSKSVDTTFEGATDTTLRHGLTGWEIMLIWKNDATLRFGANVQKDMRKRGDLMLWVLLIHSTPDTWCGQWDRSKPGPDWISEPPDRRGIASLRDDQGDNSNCCVPVTEKEGPTPVVGYTITSSHSCCRLYHHQLTLSLSCLSSILDLQWPIHIHLEFLITLLTVNIFSPCSLTGHVWGGVGVKCEQV